MGSQVLVPFRGCEDSHRHLKLMGDLGQVKQSASRFNDQFIFFFFSFMYFLSFVFWQIVPMKYHPRDVDSIKAVMAKSNVVVNLIGLFYLRPTLYSYIQNTILV
jgi:NADH dehydrogenase (ubiquinone) 1 alpha subcomplex subunit 9